MVMYFVVANERGKPDDKHYWIWNGAKLVPESRSFNDVGNAAIDKGYDVYFCSSYSGVPHYEVAKIAREAVVAMKEKGYNVRNQYIDLDFDILMRIVG